MTKLNMARRHSKDNISRTQAVRFSAEIREILGSSQDFAPLDRETLTKLATSPDVDAAWDRVRQVCGPGVNLVIRLVIWEILGARKSASACAILLSGHNHTA